MKWDIETEYSTPSSYIYVIVSKFGVHVNFVVCLVLGCFGVISSMLLCAVMGSDMLQLM